MNDEILLQTIAEIKQKNNELTSEISQHEITTSAGEKTIQQLTCKIQELEEQNLTKVMDYELEKCSLEGKTKRIYSLYLESYIYILHIYIIEYLDKSNILNYPLF